MGSRTHQVGRMRESQREQGFHLPFLIIYSKYWVLGEKREEKSVSIVLFDLKKNILKIIRHI